MSIRRVLLAIIVILGILSLSLVALESWKEHHEPLRSVWSVKDRYLQCIQKIDTDEIATCLDELSTLAYDAYPTEEIAMVLDSLSYIQKDHWCHEVMHYMGWKAYIAEGDIAKAFLHSSELCDSGMYHGVMEEFLRREGLSSNLEDLVATSCTDSLSGRPDTSDGLLELCYHGLGHGLMYVTSSDLQASLDYCDVLKETAPACYSGALMEYVISKELGPLSNQRDLSDFSYCEDLKEKHRDTCYVRQGLNNYAATRGDLGKAMELCLQVPEERQVLCFQGVGANNPAPGKAHDSTGSDCRVALDISKEAYISCIEGALGFVTQLEWGKTEGPALFCSAIEDGFKDFCYREIGRVIQPWITETETKEQKCAVLPTKEAQDLCVFGASGR